jgi:hypothetical protein
MSNIQIWITGKKMQTMLLCTEESPTKTTKEMKTMHLCYKPQISPDWNKMIEEEKVTDAVGLEVDEVDRGDEAGERIVDMRKTSRKLDNLMEEQPLRHSKRIKEQGLGNMISTDKAEALKKKNLEGTKLNFKNSFAVLDNNEFLVRSSKMGVNTNGLDLECFNILKDLEKARKPAK